MVKRAARLREAQNILHLGQSMMMGIGFLIASLLAFSMAPAAVLAQSGDAGSYGVPDTAGAYGGVDSSPPLQSPAAPPQSPPLPAPPAPPGPDESSAGGPHLARDLAVGLASLALFAA